MQRRRGADAGQDVDEDMPIGGNETDRNSQQSFHRSGANAIAVRRTTTHSATTDVATPGSAQEPATEELFRRFRGLVTDNNTQWQPIFDAAEAYFTRRLATHVSREDGGHEHSTHARLEKIEEAVDRIEKAVLNKETTGPQGPQTYAGALGAGRSTTRSTTTAVHPTRARAQQIPKKVFRELVVTARSQLYAFGNGSPE